MCADAKLALRIHRKPTSIYHDCSAETEEHVFLYAGARSEHDFTRSSTVRASKEIKMGTSNMLLPAPGGMDGRLHPRWTLPPMHNYSLKLEGFATHDSESPSLDVRRPDATPDRDVSSRFGRRLKALRLERDLTQTDMARRFGIDRSFISDVERGRKSISLPMIEVIAIGLKVTIAQLFEDL